MPLNLPTDESFLTTEEVLAYLNVNLRTVYRLIKAGSIPAVRVGRQWRFRKRDLDSWLESQRPAEQKPNAIVKSRSRILLVDDEDSVRRLLSRMLESAYDVEVAADGESALRLMREPDAHYDLLISDLNMPGMDGIQASELISQQDPNIQVVMMSVQGEADYLRRSMLAGAREFLIKPFSSEELANSLRRVNQLAASRRSVPGKEDQVWIWWMRPDGQSWRIIDLVLNGHSAVNTEAHEYANVLASKNGDMNALIAFMRKRAAQ